MSQIQWHGEIPFTHTTAILTPASLPPNPHSLSHHANTLFKHVLETISHSRTASKTVVDQPYGAAYQTSDRNDNSLQIVNTPYKTNRSTYHHGDTHVSTFSGSAKLSCWPTDVRMTHEMNESRLSDVTTNRVYPHVSLINKDQGDVGGSVQEDAELCIYHDNEGSRGEEDLFPQGADTQLKHLSGTSDSISKETFSNRKENRATHLLSNTSLHELNRPKPVQSNYKRKDHKSHFKQVTLHSLGKRAHLKGMVEHPMLNQVCGKPQRTISHFDGIPTAKPCYLNQRELRVPEKSNSRGHGNSSNHRRHSSMIVDVSILGEQRLKEVEMEISEVKEVAAVLCYRDGSSQLRAAQTKQPKTTTEFEGVCLAYPALGRGSEVLTLQTVLIPLVSGDQVLQAWCKKQLLTLLCHARVISYGAKDLAVTFFDHFSLPTPQVWSKWNLLDVGVGDWLLNPDQQSESFHQLLVKFGVESSVGSYEDSDTRSQLRNDIAQLGPLIVKVYQALKEQELWTLFVDMEVRLIPLLAAMEHSGVQINCDLLLENADLLKVKISRVESKAHKAAGHTFQISSHAQLRQVLFDELCLDEKCKKKLSKTQVQRQKSTSEAVLTQLKDLHPLPALVLEYRQLCKLNATYISGILPFINEGILRPRWLHTGSATGRVVSCNPNIQAFPKQPLNLGVVHKQFIVGKEDVEVEIEQRKVVESRNTFTFIAADFKSIELCLMAHLSEDPVLIETLHSQGDIFSQLASEWLGMKVEDVSSSDRERTKRVVYAILYGVGKEKLGEILNVHSSYAKELTNSFLAKFAGVQTFIAKTIAECREKGCLQTVCGRKRWFSQINSVNQQLRAHSERQAVNFPIQGSASDVCKCGMLKVVEMLSQESPTTRILVQIHDELLFEVPDEDVINIAEKIKCVLESPTLLPCTLKVPLKVRVTAGKTWANLNPLSTS